jgi:hypothetical protein
LNYKPSKIRVMRPKSDDDHPDEIHELKLSETAREIKGKNFEHLPMTITSSIPKPNYKENCWYPENLIEMITYIINQPSPQMTIPEFKFEMTTDAARHNWSILEKYNLNLDNALQAKSYFGRVGNTS